MATLVQLTAIQGNDSVFDLAVLEIDGSTPQDLTGYHPVMVIKASQNADDAHATRLTIGAGLLWDDQVQGTLTAYVPHAVLAVPGFAWWRLDVLDGQDNTTTAMYGPLAITAV